MYLSAYFVTLQKAISILLTKKKQNNYHEKSNQKFYCSINDKLYISIANNLIKSNYSRMRNIKLYLLEVFNV